MIKNTLRKYKSFDTWNSMKFLKKLHEFKKKISNDLRMIWHAYNASIGVSLSSKVKYVAKNLNF